MKGVCFQKPFEFNLQVEGETWRQGDPIQGRLTVRNRSDQPARLEGNAVSLGYGALKKVHGKKDGALEILDSVPFSDQSVPAQGETSLPWKFTTDRNSPITDASASLFILYGSGGVLQLRFDPDSVVQSFLDTLQVQFRFVKKSQKSNKAGCIVTKFDPPTAKGFSLVEQLAIATQFEGDTLHVGYSFDVKKLEATAASAEMKKSKKEFEQAFTPLDYRVTSGRFNHEQIEAAIREVMTQIESKIC